MILKEQFNKLNSIYYSLTRDRIEFMLNLTNSDISYDDIKEYMRDGMFNFISKAPDHIIETVISFENNFDLSDRVYHSYSWENTLKYIFSINGKIEEKVLDINSYEGINYLHELFTMPKNKNVKIIKICRFCDEIDMPEHGVYQNRTKKIEVFDGDVFMVADSFNAMARKMIIATSNSYYSPTYKELIWSDKYGYFNPKGDLNEDSENFEVQRRINTAEGRYNYHVITLGNYCKYMGNIAISNSFLEPLKTKDAN